ncbi:hypothetical protein VBZ67_03540 [Campylobacter concisus]
MLQKSVKRCGKLDILPIGVYHEVTESLHRTSTGTDGDWRNVMKQFFRTGLAYAWSSTLGTSIAMDCLFGLPKLNDSKSKFRRYQKRLRKYRASRTLSTFSKCRR